MLVKYCNSCRYDLRFVFWGTLLVFQCLVFPAKMKNTGLTTIMNAYIRLCMAGFTAYKERKVHFLDDPSVLITKAHNMQSFSGEGVHNMFLCIWDISQIK